MGDLQKKGRTTGKKSVAYMGKSGQNTGNDFPALGLGVAFYLLKIFRFSHRFWRETLVRFSVSDT